MEKHLETHPQKCIDKDFIMAWDKAVPDEFCDWLINYLNTDVSMAMGPRSTHFNVDKQCYMHNFSPSEANYLLYTVNKCCRLYAEKYHYLKDFGLLTSGVMLQQTEPMEGYHVFHCENTMWGNQQRSLAWMVYLNDVEEGGETEFLYQQLKIKPTKGRVVIWPGHFTHLHRGNPPMSTKYIATGWYSFANEIDKFYVNLNDVQVET